MPIVFLVVAALAYALFAPDASGSSKTMKQQIYDAIMQGIVTPLGLPPKAADILYFQGVKETANFTAWYFSGPQTDGMPPTYNIFNRLAGSGRGEWTGQIKMIHGDQTRIYTDVYQSARDMRQRLTDYSDMKDALAALRNGDGGAYFDALERLGYSARIGDYHAYADQWNQQEAAA